MTFIRKAPALVGSSSVSKRQSPYHASVTLFEASSSQASSESPRRSSRLQNNTSGLHDQQGQSDTTEMKSLTIVDPDIEDGDYLSESKRNTKPATSSRKRKGAISSNAVSPRKVKAIRMSLDDPHPPPDNWRETYSAIKEMRKDGGAPVDEMGCHMAGGPVDDPKVCDKLTLTTLFNEHLVTDQEICHPSLSHAVFPDKG
jgi:endonuclease III